MIDYYCSKGKCDTVILLKAIRMAIKKNIYSKGTLTFLMYPTDEGTYVAACKELCLIREGKDKESLQYRIMADAKSFIQNVRLHKLGEHLLNQNLPKEILNEFNAYRVKKMNEDFLKWMESFKQLLENKQLCNA